MSEPSNADNNSTTGDARTALASLVRGLVDPVVSSCGCEEVPADSLPAKARKLLDHHEHMTSTLRDFHGQALRLDVLDQRVEGDVYSRSINLALQAGGRIVEYGFVRMDMRLVPPAVRAEILQKAAPLGDILIKHCVLRRIDPKWFLRFSGDNPVLGWFGSDRPAEAFGRLGVIHCDGQAAIELLEVVPADGEAAM